MYLNSVQLSRSAVIGKSDLVLSGIWFTMGKERRRPSDVRRIQGNGQAGVDGQVAEIIAELDGSRQPVVAG